MDEASNYACWLVQTCNMKRCKREIYSRRKPSNSNTRACHWPRSAAAEGACNKIMQQDLCTVVCDACEGVRLALPNHAEGQQCRPAGVLSRRRRHAHVHLSFTTVAYTLWYRKRPEVQPVARTGIRSVSPVRTLPSLAFGARRVRTLVDFARRCTQKRG